MESKRGGARAGSGRKKGWSERGESGGRKPTGIKRVSFSVSCTPEELDKVKAICSKSDKTMSRYILDLVFASE